MFKAVVAVVPTLATEFNTVVEKFALFPSAVASSCNVSNDAGAAPTKFATAVLTNVWVASAGICVLIRVTEAFNVVKLVVCVLTVDCNVLLRPFT